MTEPLNINVNANASNAIRELRNLADVTLLNAQRVEQFDTALLAAEDSIAAYTNNIDKTLSTYNKLISVSKNYTQAQLASNRAVEQGATAQLNLVQNVRQIEKALSKVSGTTKQQSDAQQRTLALYGQLVALSKQEADAKLAEAKSVETLARAYAKLAETDMRQQKDTRSQEATAAAQAEKQQAEAARQQAEATKQANAALAEQDRLRRQMVTATDRMGKSYNDLAKSDSRYAVQAATSGEERLRLLEAEEKRLQDLVAQRRAAYESQRALAANTGAALSGEAGTLDATAVRAANANLAELERTHRNLTSAQNDLSAAQSRTTREREALTKATQDGTAAEQNQYSAVQGTRYAMYEVAAAYSAASLATLGFSKTAVQTSMEYQAAFAQVERVTEESRTALGPLYQDLIDLSTQIPVSFTELSKIAQIGGQLGIASSELDSFTDTIARFSATTDIAEEQAAISFGRISNLLHVSSSEFGNLGSAVLYLGTTSVATDAEILNVATSLAAAASTAGLSTQATLGLSAAFASLAVTPEVARSSIQRLFINIDRAIQDGGDDLTTWARQLGLTNKAFIDLYRNNPDEFFLRFVHSMSQAVANGESLTATFDALGIKSVRDINAFQRLAGSYDLLSSSIENARIAYAQGTFLDQSSATIFETLQREVTKLGDAWDNLVASFGGTDAVSGAVLGVVKLLTGFLKMLNEMPDGVKTAIVTFTTLIGVFAAYKAMIALALAGTLAFRYAFTNSLTLSSVSLRGLFKEITATNAAVKGLTASTATATAEERAYAASVGMSVAALRAKQGAAAGAAGASVAQGAAGAAGGALSKVGSFAKSLPGVATVFAVASVLTGLATSIGSSGDAASKSSAKMDAFASSVVGVAGGSDALKQALDADAKSAAELGDKASKSFATITRAWHETSDGGVELVTTMRRASGVTVELESKTFTASQAMQVFNATQDDLKSKIEDANKALEAQTTILGTNYQKMVANAAVTQIMDQSNEFIPQDLLDQLQARGVDIPKAIATGVLQGADALKGLLEPQFQEIDNQYGGVIRSLMARRDQLNAIFNDPSTAGTERSNVIAGDLEQVNAQLKIAQGNYTNALAPLKAFINYLGGSDTAFGRFVERVQLGASVQEAFDDILGDTTDGLEQQADAADKATKSFRDLIGTLADTITTAADVAAAYDALGASIQKNGTSFDAFTDGGRANLSALKSVVTETGNMIADQFEQGLITGEQAASMMQSYMQDLVLQLANMGVPTDQLDFLVNYTQQIVNHNWQMSIGADVSGAMAGLNAVTAQANAVIQQLSRINDGSKYSAGAAFNQWQGMNPSTTAQYTGQTVFGGNPGDELNLLGQIGKGYERAAADAAKSGGSRKKANDAAAESVKKEQEYVKDLADYYKNLGQSILSSVDLEGNVFESLQKLGISISENGTRFNTFTEDGRKNFAALEDTFNAMGAQLGASVQSGVLTASQATDRFQQFASGVYSELRKLGVAREDIDGFFNGIGISRDGWAGVNKELKQYTGVVGAAAAASKGAAVSASDAALKLGAASSSLKQYVSDLSGAMDDIYDSIYGLPTAVDASATAFNRMQQAAADAADKVADLKKQNEDLQQTIGDAQIDARKAGLEQALSIKYGETDRAADYGQQKADAEKKIKDAQDQIAANNKTAAAIQAGMNALTGYTQAAIDNRGALRDLQKTMFDQIKAYAETGASQQDVAKYAEELKGKFSDQMIQLGYTGSQVKTYTGTFDTYVKLIQTVPRNVDTKVNTNTDDAKNALNAIPKNLNVNVKTTAVSTSLQTTKAALATIPDRKNYFVDVKTTGVSAAQNAINGITGKTVTVTVNTVHNDTYLEPRLEFLAQQQKNKKYQGGIIGMATGGLLPGTPPSDPTKDNIFAIGPGNQPYKLRSREFIQSQPAVDYYGVSVMQAMNERRIPRSNFMADGGLIGQLFGASSANGNALAIVELSPTDREYLRTIADKNLVVRIGDKEVADAAARGGASKTRRGGI